MTELSNEDILRIVRHFLLSSPPGEFEDVLADIREMISNDELLNQAALEIFHTYNIEQLIPVDVPEKDYKVILCKYSEVDQTHFIDPHSNQILTVDHTKGVVTAVDAAEPVDEETGKKRSAIQAAMDKYVADHYLSGLCTVYSSTSDKNDFYVCVTASKFNEKNFWSGRWRSIYRVSFTDDSKAKLSGTMRVNVHYYETGNIQLNTSKEHGETASASDVAAEIAKIISKAEGAFQADVDNACNNLNDTFKSLRKRLPMDKKLFDFNISAHKFAASFGGKK